MQIKISARKSELARLQAYAVGQALKHAGYQNLIYEFSSSLGDQNAHDPLWQMPEKGVFTADLTRALQEGRTDMVVHSWKDLPTEENPQTVIAGTLPRADSRDLLLIKRSADAEVTQSKTLRIFSSSPRRAYNLQDFLKWALPLPVEHVSFENIRGNMTTRLRKCLEGDAHGIVVAKAALDRLLGYETIETPGHERESFSQTAQFIRDALTQFRFVVLPLSLCPSAAAQGALAIEVRRDRPELLEAIQKINCTATYQDVQLERKTLRSYGGGCHQKIGVAALSRSYGRCFFLRGQTDQGEILRQAQILSKRRFEPASYLAQIFPATREENHFYDREPLSCDLTFLEKTPHFVFVAREHALPSGVNLHSGSLVWTAGLQTWRKLAQRGFWVAGSTDALGERESPQLGHLLREPLPEIKLSHDSSPGDNRRVVATYHLKEIAQLPDLRGKTHFFWSSASAFERGIAKYPEIRTAVHACGPGHTYDRIVKMLDEEGRVHVFLTYEEWRDAVLNQS